MGTKGRRIHRKISVKRRSGLALALSGGGYRATLFHLGMLRRLNELDLLKSVKAVSSVSGGSITSAQLALTAERWKNGRLSDADWEHHLRDPLFRFCAHNLRTGPVLRSLFKFWDKGVAVRETEASYRRLLTRQTLGDLPTSVDFIFCATDMVFSTHWYFRRKTSAAKRTGNHRAGRIKDWQSIPVARAVAASSCFPPAFGPMVLGLHPDDLVKPRKRGKDWEKLVQKIRLTDGGLYDNLGIEPVWNDYQNLIVSDGGKPSPATPLGIAGQLPRLPGLLQEQIENLRKRWLIERDKSKAVDFNTTMVSINDGDAPGGYTAGFTQDVLAKIRTDLDSFSDTEGRALENHGYTLADAKLKANILPKLRGIPFDTSARDKLQPPNPGFMNETALRAAMRKSHKRTLLYAWRIR